MCYVGKATKIFIIIVSVLAMVGLVLGFGFFRRGLQKTHKCVNGCRPVFPDPIPATTAPSVSNSPPATNSPPFTNSPPAPSTPPVTTSPPAYNPPPPNNPPPATSSSAAPPNSPPNPALETPVAPGPVQG